MRALWIAAGLVVVELLLLARMVMRSGFIGLGLFLLVSAGIGLFVVRLHAPRALAGWRAGGFDEKTEDQGAWDALMGVLAGVLLIVPGVLSDVAGLLLLFPPVRAIAVHDLRGRLRPLVRSSGVMNGLSNLRSFFSGRGSNGSNGRRDKRADVIDIKPKDRDGSPE